MPSYKICNLDLERKLSTPTTFHRAQKIAIETVMIVLPIRRALFLQREALNVRPVSKVGRFPFPTTNRSIQQVFTFRFTNPAVTLFTLKTIM